VQQRRCTWTSEAGRRPGGHPDHRPNCAPRCRLPAVITSSRLSCLGPKRTASFGHGFKVDAGAARTPDAVQERRVQPPLVFHWSTPMTAR